MDERRAVPEICATLDEMERILTVHKRERWAKVFRELLDQFSAAGELELKNVAREALGLFGGMASLSDIVLTTEGAVPVEANDRFDELRARLHSQLVDLIVEGGGQL